MPVLQRRKLRRRDVQSLTPGSHTDMGKDEIEPR